MLTCFLAFLLLRKKKKEKLPLPDAIKKMLLKNVTKIRQQFDSIKKWDDHSQIDTDMLPFIPCGYLHLSIR